MPAKKERTKPYATTKNKQNYKQWMEDAEIVLVEIE